MSFGSPQWKKNDQQDCSFQIHYSSYEPHKWFQVNEKERFSLNPLLTRILPEDRKMTMGQFSELYIAAPSLDLAYWGDFGSTKGSEASAMHVSGKLLAEVIRRNPHTFRIFSPDELMSNKLDAVFEVEGIGHRNFQTDPDSMTKEPNKGGRIIEMLSEHTLQGFSQGYSLTGRTCLFPSYESFIGVSFR